MSAGLDDVATTKAGALLRHALSDYAARVEAAFVASAPSRSGQRKRLRSRSKT